MNNDDAPAYLYIYVWIFHTLLYGIGWDYCYVFSVLFSKAIGVAYSVTAETKTKSQLFLYPFESLTTIVVYMNKRKRQILFVPLLVSSFMAYADDAVRVSVGNEQSVSQTAQFLLSQHPTFQFIDGKAVMTLGDGTTHVAELPMSNGAQMSIECSTYDESSNKISASVSSAGYGTLYSAFQLTLPDGVEVYAPTYDSDTRKLKLNSSTIIPEGTAIPVGTGVILKNQGTYDFDISSDAPSDVTSALSGSAVTIPASTITDGEIYSLAKENGIVAFYHYTGENIIGGKAFLVLNEVSMSKEVMFDFSGNDTPTGVEEVKEENAIAKNVRYFNIAGQRVNPDKASGIVIVEGKKIVKKLR